MSGKSTTRNAPKIGEIRLTDQQKQIIAEGVETEFFKVLARVVRPKRQTRVALLAVNAAQDEKDLWFYKGMSGELDWLIRHMEDVAAKWNKQNLDADTDGED
jgi:hypothetical protein